ncbi:MAG: hypothetical protein HKN50_06205 [Gammaproteobacteria bacterium]|nr:hypothetical protein [Gammaproteobacteria bacterium]
MLKLLRIALLLIVLISVWSTANLQRNVTQDWRGTLDVAIIPVIADDQANTERFVGQLRASEFEPIKQYFATQGRHYGRDLSHALSFSLQSPLRVVPPESPAPGSGSLAVAWWSLKLRWWAWRHASNTYHNGRIRLYILYQSPAEEINLSHSVGLQKGLIGIIQARAFNSQTSLHQVVVAHELLHILRATDKYDLNSGQPQHPQGYADASQSPLYPQRKAEIMARSLPVSANSHRVAVYLRDTIIGPLTAQEIGW